MAVSLVPLMLVLLGADARSDDIFLGAQLPAPIDGQYCLRILPASRMGFGPRCAQTPQGRCQVMDGQVVCFDPPAYVAGAYGSSLPEPECKAGETQAACGYSCTHVLRQAQVRAHPGGVNLPGPRGMRWSALILPPRCSPSTATTRPKSECRSQGTDFACGYHCAASAVGE